MQSLTKSQALVRLRELRDIARADAERLATAEVRKGGLFSGLASGQAEFAAGELNAYQMAIDIVRAVELVDDCDEVRNQHTSVSSSVPTLPMITRHDSSGHNSDSSFHGPLV